MTPAERVRLLLVQNGDALGPAERLVWELATRLNPARYALSAWLSPADDLDELAGTLSRRGVTVARRVEPRSRWAAGAHFEAWGAIKRAAPSLIHVHAAWGALPLRLLRLARLMGGAPVLVSLPGPPEVTPDGLSELKAADVVTVGAEAWRDALLKDGLARDRVRVVPHGADLPDDEAEGPAARRLRSDCGAGMFKPLWVCAARLEPGRGHETLLEALADLAGRGTLFVAVLAGEGSRRHVLERRVRELGLEAHVRFAGEPEALGPLLLAADAFLLPAHEEGHLGTLLQAMARARPVVATSVGVVPELIEDGVSGRLVAAGDAAALAAALADFHRQPDAARRLGLMALERVRAGRTWPQVVEAHEAIYDDLLGLAGFAPDAEARPGAPRAR